MAEAATADAKPSFRKPELHDLVFSIKAFAAAAFALGFGFSQGFENPYWSALTIYIVVNPPGAGAVRSKSFFRLIGTLIGGTLILATTGAFADHPAGLLVALITIVVGATFLNRIDRKPTNYIWFAVAVTGAAVGIARMSQPSSLFDLTMARVGEIVFGILVITAVDGVFWPRVMTPDFLKQMGAWRRQARDWVADALADAGAADDRRQAGVRSLVQQVSEIDAKGVQLPFDPIARAPRSAHVSLLRKKLVHLVAGFGSIESWAGPLRAGGLRRSGLGPSLDAIVAWLRAAPTMPGDDVDRHVADGERLAADLDETRAGIDPAASRTALLQHGLLARLAAFVRDWSDLSLVLDAIARGEQPPARLADEARRVRTVRSTDRLAAARDVLPMFVGMGLAALIWYLTAWNAGLQAVIFAFVAGLLMLGQEATLKMAAGSLVVIVIAFALVFFYEFVVLPRVTEFPVLLMVLGCALLPLGVLMSIHPIGLLLAMLMFSMLGLKNAYNYDFEQTLQVVSGGVAGYTIGVFCLRLFDYDRPRFATRRLADAARRDVVDVARSPRPIDPERYLSLAVDRVSLFFKSAAQLDGDAPPPARMMDDLSIGNHLLALRRLAPEVSPHAQAVIRTLSSEAGRHFELLRDDPDRPSDTTLAYVVKTALDDPAVRGDGARAGLLDALVGIQLALGERAPTSATPA